MSRDLENRPRNRSKASLVRWLTFAHVAAATIASISIHFISGCGLTPYALPPPVPTVEASPTTTASASAETSGTSKKHHATHHKKAPPYPSPSIEASASAEATGTLKHHAAHHKKASPYPPPSAEASASPSVEAFQSPSIEVSPSPETILPTFFPPTATCTVELQIIPALQNLTLQQSSDRITEAMNDSGYEQRSYFWLDKEHGPGFAVVTHIEQIDPDGVPVSKGRWSFDLPSYESFSIARFLKAMFKADPGNYRLIALVLSRTPFEEKKGAITQDQVAELNRGPKFLAQTKDSSTVVTRDYHCIAYIYEFERKTRNDDPIFKDTSKVSASAHLASTPLWKNLTQLH
jgi:hypothetical protein